MFKRLFAAFALCAAFTGGAQAYSVRQLELDEIINVAEVAFEGTVISTHSATDPVSHRIVTYTTFRVNDALKGKVGATHTIKQLGGDLPAEGRFFNVGLRTRYAVGQSVVVFLYGESKLGFSSPVGVDQGNFGIVEDESGVSVSNGRDFGEMTSRMAGSHADQNAAKAVAKARGAGRKMGLKDFKDLVRAHAGAAQ